MCSKPPRHPLPCCPPQSTGRAGHSKNPYHLHPGAQSPWVGGRRCQPHTLAGVVCLGPIDAEKGGSLVVGDFETAAKYGECCCPACCGRSRLRCPSRGQAPRGAHSSPGLLCDSGKQLAFRTVAGNSAVQCFVEGYRERVPGLTAHHLLTAAPPQPSPWAVLANLPSSCGPDGALGPVQQLWGCSTGGSPRSPCPALLLASTLHQPHPLICKALMSISVLPFGLWPLICRAQE